VENVHTFFIQIDNVSVLVHNTGEEKVAVAATRARAGKTIANSNGVKIQSYGSGDSHKPAHVKGGGKEVRIGPNGKPLKKQPELSAKQKKVVQKNKTAIIKELRKVGKANQRAAACT